MATVTPEQMKKALSSLSALEGMASGYCELQDGFDTSKVIAENVRQVLAALASTPPAAPPEDAPVYPNSDKGLAQMCPGVPLPVLRGIQEAAFRAGREDALTAAQAPPESDPPGLVGVVGEFQRARANYRRAKHEDIGQEDAWARLKAARDAVLAYPLPASPQAETMPTIQIGDIVQVGESTGVIDSASKATFWSQQVLDAIYRDPLWRRPTTGDK